MSEIVTLREGLATLSALTGALSKASGTLLGRSANSITYLSGSDMGTAEGRKLDRTDNLAHAIEMLMNTGLRGWRTELWKDVDQADTVVQESDHAWAWPIPFAHTSTIRRFDWVAYDWLLMGAIPVKDLMTVPEPVRSGGCSSWVSVRH